MINMNNGMMYNAIFTTVPVILVYPVNEGALACNKNNSDTTATHRSKKE